MAVSSALHQQLLDYYSRRAREHDAVYELPERQNDLVTLETILTTLVSSLSVLEVACGTGYWTHRLSRAAASIVATDISPEVLLIARRRSYLCPTSFAIADARVPQPIRRCFDALVAGFWWSHLPLGQLTSSIQALSLSVHPGGHLVLFDNRFVAGSSTPIATVDDQGNTYQQRMLSGGETHLVLKNFPSTSQVETILTKFGAIDPLPHDLTFYWLSSCRIGPAA